MTDPIAVLLKFAFIVVLYLFLLWVARSALRDLGRPAPAHGGDAPYVPAAAGSRPLLVVEAGDGLSAGATFDVDGSLTIGRSPQMDVPLDDSFASGRHARIYEEEGLFYVEDMGSTNGTYLNGQRVDSRELLRPDDVVRIGDTEFRYQQ